MSNSETHYHFKLEFQKVGQHTGKTWAIHGTKHRHDYQLQCPEPHPVEYPKRASKYNIKESDEATREVRSCRTETI